MGVHTRHVSLLLLGVFCVATSACAHAQAKTVTAPPPLDVPLPPPRIIQQNAGSDQQPIGAPVGSPSGDGLPRGNPATATAGRGAAPPRGNDAARPAEPARPETAAAAETPKPEEPRATSPSPLQTTTTQREEEGATAIRQQLLRAQNDLMTRVDYRRLNADARLQYDTAKGFITQGFDALDKRDLVLARSVANKAATIASQLAGR